MCRVRESPAGAGSQAPPSPPGQVPPPVRFPWMSWVTASSRLLPGEDLPSSPGCGGKLPYAAFCRKSAPAAPWPLGPVGGWPVSPRCFCPLLSLPSQPPGLPHAPSQLSSAGLLPCEPSAVHGSVGSPFAEGKVATCRGPWRRRPELQAGVSQKGCGSESVMGQPARGELHWMHRM